MSCEKLDRNIEIHAKLKQGISVTTLAKEYGLSYARIKQIDNQVRYDRMHIAPDIIEIAIACDKLHAVDWMNKHIQQVLRNRHLNKRNRWRKLTRDDILKLNSIGEKSADIIEYAQKL